MLRNQSSPRRPTGQWSPFECKKKGLRIGRQRRLGAQASRPLFGFSSRDLKTKRAGETPAQASSFPRKLESATMAQIF